MAEKGENDMNDFNQNANTQALEPNEQIKKRIEDTKALIKAELPKYENLAKDIKVAAKDLADKKKKYDKNPGPKTTPDYQIAQVKYNRCNNSTAESQVRLETYISDVKADWEKLIGQLAMLDTKRANKEGKEYSNYVADVENKKYKVDESLEQAGIVLEKPETVKYEEPVAEAAPVVDEAPAVEEAPVVDEAPVVEEAPVAEVAPVADENVYQAGRAGVNLAPVNLDISTYVESAVAKAMDKFSVTLDKKIDDYFAGYTPAVGAVAGVAVGGAEAAELQAKIAEDEKFLADKLAGIVEILKGLNNAMATVTSAYAELDNRFRAAVELQKQTNDMMRHTLREQQGVQVNQRVIAQDQLTIAEEQQAMLDSQKLAIEDQKALTEAQTALADEQGAALEAQSALQDSMKEFVKEQKKVIAAQQTTAARLTECADLQRTSLDDIKEILKGQKSIASKTAKRRSADAE